MRRLRTGMMCVVQELRSQTSFALPFCWFFISTFIISMQSFAQRSLTLNECINIAFERSYTARTSRERLKSSEASAQSARRSLYSSVDLSFDLPEYSNALTQYFNTTTQRNEFFRTEQLRMNGSLAITQPIIWTNTTLSVSGNLYRLDQRLSLNDNFFRDYYTQLAIIIRQPLLVPNSLSINLRRAELDYEQALSDYKRATLDIIYNVTQSFNQLYSAQQRFGIQQDRVRQQEESFRTAQNQFKAGLIAEVEAMQLDVDLAAARNDLFNSENDLLQQSNSFKLLIGLPQSDQFELRLTDTTFHRVKIDLEKAIAEGKNNRIELQRARNDVTRSELSLDEVRSRRRIRGDITVSYGISKNDPRFQDLFAQMLDSKSASLTLTIPIFDWGKHSYDVESAEAQLHSARYTAENTEQVIELEIFQLVKKIESASSRVEVLSASEVVARKAFDINLARFRIGTIGSNELAQSQTRYTTARISALEALLEYRIALADLIRKTFYDFELNQPVNTDF